MFGFFGIKILFALIVIGIGLWRINRSLKQGLEKPANIRELEARAQAERKAGAGDAAAHRRRMGLE